MYDFAGLTILQCFLISREVAEETGCKVYPPEALKEYLKRAGEQYREKIEMSAEYVGDEDD